MGKEVAVANQGGMLAAFTGDTNPFLEAGKGEYESFGSFMKFNGNTGKLEEKVDDDYEELPRGSAFAFNMATAQHGWICWVDGEVKDERNDDIIAMRPFPNEKDLPDYGPYEEHDDGTSDGWQEQYIFHLFNEKTETSYTLKLSSKSGLRSARKFLKDFGKKVAAHLAADGTIDVPIVEVDAVSFDIKKEDGSINKKAGKKWAPTFKIIDWGTYAEFADVFDEIGNDSGEDAGDYADKDEDDKPSRPSRSARSEPADDPEPRQTRRGRRTAKEEEPEEEEETARPSRRRAAPDPEPEDDDDAGNGDDDDDAPEERPAGRRTRVVHAEPDEDEDEGSDTSPRESARARRGRRGRG